MTGGELRLLLVEDNPGDARLIREMVRELGYAADVVEVAPTLGEAIGRLADGPFDAVLLDLGLPDSQGLPTLERVIAPWRDVPVIVLTGLADREVGLSAVRHGAQDYLVKGEVNADMLGRAIRYAIGRHVARAAATMASVRAAAAEERLRATEEGRAALEHEIEQRRRAQSDLERTLRRLQALRAIDEVIITQRALAPMLEEALRQIVAHLSVEAATVLLVSPGSDELRVAAARGLPAGHLGTTRLPRHDPVLFRALHDGHAAVQAEGPEPPPFARQELLRSAGMRRYEVVRLMVRAEALGVIELFERGGEGHGGDWDAFRDTLAGQTAMAIDSAQLQEGAVLAGKRLAGAYDETIEGWSRALDLRDRETEGHSRRVTALSVRMARAVGIVGAELLHLRRGALLHDIGKMGIPDQILQKPGKLSEPEWELMRRHPLFARNLLQPIAFLRPAIVIPYAHHEKWDGSGYPRGLEGDDIPLPARVFALADVYDALTSDRPYRPAWTPTRARAHIVEQAGAHFDPDLVPTFLETLDAAH